VGRLAAPLPRKEIQIAPFFIDEFPVTNAKFKVFLDATHYAPADKGNFYATGRTAASRKAGTIGP